MADPRQPALTPLQMLDKIDAALADMHAHLEHLRGMGRIVSPQAGQLLAVCESRAKECRLTLTTEMPSWLTALHEAEVNEMFRTLGLE